MSANHRMVKDIIVHYREQWLAANRPTAGSNYAIPVVFIKVVISGLATIRKPSTHTPIWLSFSLRDGDLVLY
jgi:hypothetical protein